MAMPLAPPPPLPPLPARPTLPGLLGIVLLCSFVGHLPAVLDLPALAVGRLALRPRARPVESDLRAFLNQTATALEGAALLREAVGLQPAAAAANDASEALMLAAAEDEAEDAEANATNASIASFKALERETAELVQQVLAEETEAEGDADAGDAGDTTPFAALLEQPVEPGSEQNATALMLEVQRMAREALAETRSMQRERESEEEKRMRIEWEPHLRSLLPPRLGHGFKAGPRNDSALFVTKAYLNSRKIPTMIGTRDDAVALMSHGCVPDADMRLRYAQCAVVGSSWHASQQGSRKAPQRYGKYIDNHDAVFRVNDAKGRDFDRAEFVGRRTEYRVLSMPWSMAVSEHDFHKLGSQGYTAFTSLKAVPSQKYKATVLVLAGGLPFETQVRACMRHRQSALLRLTPDIARTVAHLFRIAAKRVLGLLAAQEGRCDLVCRMFDGVTGGTRHIGKAIKSIDVPAGLTATVLAMSLCRKVRLYGFSEEGRLRDIILGGRIQDAFPSLRLRYHEKDSKMARIRAEKAILQLGIQAELLSALEASERITLCSSENGGIVQRECAAKAIAGGVIDPRNELGKRATEVGRGGFATEEGARLDAKAAMLTRKRSTRAEDIKRRFFAAQAQGGGLLFRRERKKGLIAGLGDSLLADSTLDAPDVDGSLAGM